MVVNCPKCEYPNAERLDTEVDIGVGVQVHTYGYECPLCGQIAVFNCCGSLDFQGHAAWCNEAKGN